MKWLSRWTVSVLVMVVVLSAPPPAARAQDEVSWLLSQINTLRGSLGLHAYSLNPQLSAAATQHSQYMADTCDVSHTESNGSTAATRARANGYTGNWVSENIYMGGSAGAESAWNFWINSSIHYQGLTHQVVNEIGIGVAYGACGQGYTLVFGHRADVTAPPAPPAASDANAAAAAEVAAEQPVYVPPPPTYTPTPTIPTLTPSATWTITPTHTEAPVQSPTPRATNTPTSTPLVLPTVPALEPAASRTPIVIAQRASPVPPTVPPTNTPTPTATPPTTRTETTPGSERDVPAWLPLVLLVSALMIGGVGIAIWWRVR